MRMGHKRALASHRCTATLAGLALFACALKRSSSNPIPFMLAEKSRISIVDFKNGLGREWAHVSLANAMFQPSCSSERPSACQMCECIVRELADLNPGVSIDQRGSRISARMRQLVLLMHNALFAIPAFSDGLHRASKVASLDFVCGAPRSIQFEALGNAGELRDTSQLRSRRPTLGERCCETVSCLRQRLSNGLLTEK